MLDSVGYQVDDLTVANDFEPVDGKIALVRQPRELQRSKTRERFGTTNIISDVGISAYDAILQPDLPVEQDDFMAFCHGLFEIDRRNPFGSSLELDRIAGKCGRGENGQRRYGAIKSRLHKNFPQAISPCSLSVVGPKANRISTKGNGSS